jgi:restriction system protein
MQNTPSFFEGLIIELLVKMGYGGSRPDAAAQLGRSGDGGVDGVINEDRLGLDRVYLQAKRYSALPTPFEDKRLACLGKMRPLRRTAPS